MGRFAVAALFSAVLVGPSGATHQEAYRDRAPTSPRRAEVAGRVAVVASDPAPPSSLSPYARRRYTPPQDPGVPRGEEDAFVYIEPFGGVVSAASPEAVVVTQRDRTIIPHVAVTRVGQTVEFPNEDDVFHNLFSLSPGNRFSLGRYGPGVTETNVFEQAGVVRLFCDIHAEMAGVILVVDTPWVTRVEPGGTYRIAGVPSGRYRAIAWHPTAGADTTEVDLAASDRANVDFSLRPGR